MTHLTPTNAASLLIVSLMSGTGVREWGEGEKEIGGRERRESRGREAFSGDVSLSSEFVTSSGPVKVL